MKRKLRFILPLCLMLFAYPQTAYSAGPGDAIGAQKNTVSGAESSDTAHNTAQSTIQKRLVPDETSINYAGSHAEPIFGVQTEKPLVALSFDAGSTRGNASAIMDILEKHNLKSTFFITGDWLNAYPDEAASIVSRGHELGNHSVKHPSFKEISADRMQSEVGQTHQMVKDMFGIDMCLFRFPYGDYNNTAIDVLKNNGYYCIQWTVDSIDWKNEGREIIINRVLNHKNLGNGSIVLMHLAADYTPSALEEIIAGIQAKGYSIVPVSGLIYEKDYHMNYAGIQIPTNS